jgi:hypothetical protein
MPDNVASDGDLKTDFWVLRYDTVLGHCAYDVMKLFLLYLTERYGNLAGETKQVNGYLRNTIIDGMSNLLLASRLASDLSDARSCILPAFALRGRLPLKMGVDPGDNYRDLVVPPDFPTK